jgi:hypothetical protein
MTISKPPVRAEVPDHDLVALGFMYENGVLRSPAPCGVKITPIQNHYLIKIELPRSNTSLVLDIEKRRLKIAVNKVRRWP